MPEYRDHRLNRSGEIWPEAVGIFGHFSNNDRCQPEVAGDVISVMAAEYVGMDIRAKIGDSSSNSSGDIWNAHFVIDDAISW